MVRDEVPVGSDSGNGDGDDDRCLKDLGCGRFREGTVRMGVKQKRSTKHFRLSRGILHIFS
jgi:hypothetical protein